MSNNLQFLATPTITVNPSGRAPLVAILHALTGAPAALTLHIDDGVRQWSVSGGNAKQTLHEIALLDLRSGRSHKVRVTASAANGEAVECEGIQFDTAPLPAVFPSIKVLKADTAQMEPGYTVFPSRPSDQAQGFGDFGAIIAVDAKGEVVWYYQPGHFVDAPRRLRNGNFLYIGPNQTLFEADIMGRIVAKWQALLGAAQRDIDAVAIPTRQFHHDVFEMPCGNILAASLEIRSYDNYPTSDKDANAPREPSKVVGDVIVEFTRDGRMVNEWKLLDLIDPYRFGYGGLLKGNPRRADTAARNWSHCNSVFYDEKSDAIILSVRRQDAILKISRKTGELVWILGTDANWRSPWKEKLLKPDASIEWQYHQHDATVTPEGTVMCFDNGNYRSSPFEAKMPPEQSYSRAVEFAVDEKARTVRQVWEYGKHREEKLFSVYVGGSAFMPKTGNVLADFGGITTDASGRYLENPGGGIGQVRMVEVTRGARAEVVFELALTRASNEGAGWDAYRGLRIADLFGRNR